MYSLFDPISPKRKQTLVQIDLELRERLPFLWHPQFKISAQQGYANRTFGACAGFYDSLNAYNVTHEVAHAIEMTLLTPRIWKRRLTCSSFDMQIKTHQTVLGQRYYEPVTLQATERECRVGGIQKHLLEMGGYDIKGFVQDFAITLKYTADYFLGGSCPLNTHDVDAYSADEKRWLHTRMDLIDAAYKSIDKSEIEVRWNKVMCYFEKLEHKETASLAHAEPIFSI